MLCGGGCGGGGGGGDGGGGLDWLEIWMLVKKLQLSSVFDHGLFCW